jgi:hypothetical protein
VSSIVAATRCMALCMVHYPDRPRSVFGFVGAPFASSVLLQLASQLAKCVRTFIVDGDGSALKIAHAASCIGRVLVC